MLAVLEPLGKLTACSQGQDRGLGWGKHCSAPEKSGSYPLPGAVVPTPFDLRSSAASRHL